MGRSHGFGSNPANCEVSLRLPLRPIQTRFRCGSVSETLNLTLPKLTRQLILQKARSHPKLGLPLLVGGMVSGTFNSPPGVLFAFPSRY